MKPVEPQNLEAFRCWLREKEYRTAGLATRLGREAAEVLVGLPEEVTDNTVGAYFRAVAPTLTAQQYGWRKKAWFLFVKWARTQGVVIPYCIAPRPPGPPQGEM